MIYTHILMGHDKQIYSILWRAGDGISKQKIPKQEISKPSIPKAEHF